jgi:hypothetical protein
VPEVRCNYGARQRGGNGVSDKYLTVDMLREKIRDLPGDLIIVREIWNGIAADIVEVDPDYGLEVKEYVNFPEPGNRAKKLLVINL